MSPSSLVPPAPVRGADPRTYTSIGPSVDFIVRMDGVTNLDGGSAIDTWFFKEPAAPDPGGFNGDRVLPSPLIEGVEGQLVQITLDSPMPHTIHLHGLDVDQANDGVASTSGYVADPDFVGGFGRVGNAVNLGTPFTYEFIAPHAGTYIYHCHIDTVVHLERGMYGIVVVRPPDGSLDRAWAGGPTFDREYVWHLHTFDSSWETITRSDNRTTRYRPDLFMLNGRSGADVATDTTASITAAAGEVVHVRVANFSYVPALVDFGGLTFDVIASDGRPLATTLTGQTQQLVAAGERYDLLFTMPMGFSGSATIRYRDLRNRAELGTVSPTVTAT
ncbi:MAG: multicopper oxidase domain-containing protein [Acidobacteriota bacterium]